MADFIYMMESRLTPEQQKGVTLVQDVARAHEMNVYLVGGVVRDIISGAAIRDLDFAVQGNALKLQKDLERSGAIVQGVDENLKTLFLLLPGNLRGEVTSTRQETYDKPGKPPEIAPATINEDVRRRDFTVNAMALSLNPGSRGLLLDPFNGVADIEGKLIRILHNYSFLEEPSRLIRATRFAARLDWTLEERTKARYDAAKENDYMAHVNRKLLGHEIEQIAHENDPLKVMKALEREEWLHVLHPHWSVAKVDVSGLHHLMKVRQQMIELGYILDAGPAMMHFITDKLNSADLQALQTAIPRKAFVAEWRHQEDEAKELAKKLTSRELASNAAAWKFLSHAKPETILFTAVTTRVSAAAKRIADFLGKWRQLKTRLPFPEMAEMRITTDLPEYPKIAEEAFLLMLDGKLKSHNEIVKFLKPYSPPEPVAPPPPVRRGRGKKAEAAAAPVAAAPGPVVAKGKGKKTEAAPSPAKNGKPVPTAKPEAKPSVEKKPNKPAKKAAPKVVHKKKK
jgi:tRNA nucleotidyltransferase (CCA-adding enzyme)